MLASNGKTLDFDAVVHLFVMLAGFVGLDTHSIKEMAIDEVKKLIASTVQHRMELAATRIRGRLDRAGHGLPVPPRAISEKERNYFVHRALFFLWKEVTQYGVIADVFRDAFEDNVRNLIAVEELSEKDTKTGLEIVLVAQGKAIAQIPTP